MDIFRRNENNTWKRGEEIHEERAYTVEELTGFLQEAGFTDIHQYAELKMSAPTQGEQRIFFVAKKTEKMQES